MHLLDNASIKSSRQLITGRRKAADDLRNTRNRVTGVTRVNTFRGKSQEKILARLEPALLKLGEDQLFRRTGISRTFQDHQRAPGQVLCNGPHRGQHKGDIRRIPALDRCWDTDDNHLAAADQGRIQRRDKKAFPDRARNRSIAHIGDKTCPVKKMPDAFRVRIDPECLEPLRRKTERQRQANITKPDNRNTRLTRMDPGQQLFTHCHHARSRNIHIPIPPKPWNPGNSARRK